MRTTLLYIAALTFGFFSGGYVSVPFFHATDTVVPKITSTPPDSQCDIAGKSPCKPEIPDSLLNTVTTSAQTATTTSKIAAAIIEPPHNEDDRNIQASNPKPLVTKTIVSPTPLPLPTLTLDKAESTYATEIQNLIIEATKNLRKQESLPIYATDATLTASAKKYSSRLLAGDYLSHLDENGCDLTCRFDESGYKASSWGENLAMMEYTEQPNPSYVANFFMTQWLKSTGHRKNILSHTFTYQGVGVSVKNGKVYVVVHFAQPL